MISAIMSHPPFYDARWLQHKTCEDAMMAQTWRLQRDKAYLDRAREIFVERCASQDMKEAVINSPAETRQYAEGHLQNRLKAMKRVTGTSGDGTVRCLASSCRHGDR